MRGIVGVGKMIVNVLCTDYIAQFIMPILTDYHVHTPLCKHANGPLERYIEHAIELGLREIGFSDHCPLPNGLGAAERMAEDELDLYVNTVLSMRQYYVDRIEVKLGLEIDYVEGQEDYCRQLIEKHPWDYLIGGVHYLDPECRISSWPRNFAGDPAQLYARYFAQLRRLAHSGLCDIIAHFDVPKRSGRPPTQNEAEDIANTLEEICAAGLCLEINTSGYRHVELVHHEPYPAFSTVEQAIALGIPLMVNSDAHDPSHIGEQFRQMSQFLLSRNCRNLVTFNRRKRATYPL